MGLKDECFITKTFKFSLSILYKFSKGLNRDFICSSQLSLHIGMHHPCFFWSPFTIRIVKDLYMKNEMFCNNVDVTNSLVENFIIPKI